MDMFHLLKLCLICLLCLPLAARSAIGQVNRGMVHPAPENIPEATDPSLVIDLSDIDRWPEGPFVPDTTGMETAFFGREDGEEYELLVRVQDIATDGQGNIFVLDADITAQPTSDSKTVHVIDTGAQYLSSFGSSGAGPGEFMYPARVLVEEGVERILVAGSDREVDVFERKEQEAYRYFRSWKTRVSAHDACILRNHIYLLGYDPVSGHVIHKYSLDGEYVHGFGEPYASTNAYVVSLLSTEGTLSCVAQHGVIGHIRNNIPVLAAYDEDGALLWRVRVEGIKPEATISVNVNSDGELQVSFLTPYPPKKGSGQLTVSQAYGDGHFYLGVRKALGDEDQRDLVFRVDALSGAWTHIGHGIMPRITEDDLIVTSRKGRMTAPQVIVRSRH